MAAIIREDRVPYPFPVFIKHNLSDMNLENGMLVGVKGFASGERELYNVGKIAAGDMLAIVNCDTVQYDDRLSEEDFLLKKDVPGNANYLQKGEMYTIAKIFVEGNALAVGDKLKAKATTTHFEKDSVGTDAIAVIRRLVTFEGQESVTIEIL